MKQAQCFKGILIVFCGFLLVLGSQVASATTISECLGLIEGIQNDLGADCNGIQLLGRNTERTCASLNSKLVGAIVKLDQMKPDDAIHKLQDFISSLEAMRDAPKPKVADGIVTVQSLIDQAYAAIQCIQDIGID